MATAISTAASMPDALLWPSPRLSFSRDFHSERPESDTLRSEPASDFEFHLHEPASIITADELFSNGKLITLQPNSSPRDLLCLDQDSPSLDLDPDEAALPSLTSEVLMPAPRPPMCTSRWKYLLRLKRAKAVPLPVKKTDSNPNANPRALRFLLKKNTIPKPPSEPSMNLPLLLPSDPDQNESSSASLPQIRLVRPVPLEESSKNNADPDQVRPNRTPVQQTPLRSGASIDSPRLNAAGKVVFTGLERSSSSPGSFSGGPQVKYRGIERSYSANVNGVRIAPVLNVPVCSLRGSRKSVSVFGFERIFKGERRERNGSVPTSSGLARNNAGATKARNEQEEK